MNIISKVFPNAVFDEQRFTNMHTLLCIDSYIFPLLHFERKNLRKMPPPAPCQNRFLSDNTFNCIALNRQLYRQQNLLSRMPIVLVRTDQVLKERVRNVAACGRRWEKVELLGASNPTSTLSCLSSSQYTPG